MPLKSLGKQLWWIPFSGCCKTIIFHVNWFLHRPDKISGEPVDRPNRHTDQTGSRSDVQATFNINECTMYVHVRSCIYDSCFWTNCTGKIVMKHFSQGNGKNQMRCFLFGENSENICLELNILCKGWSTYPQRCVLPCLQGPN